VPGVRIFTPLSEEERGCQLSLTFGEGRAAADVLTALEGRGVVCDVRKPNIVRAAPMPLYSRCVAHVWQAIMAGYNRL
jgi:kynureninase